MIKLSGQTLGVLQQKCASNPQTYALSVTYGDWGKIQEYGLSQTDLASNTTTSQTRYYSYGSLNEGQTTFAPNNINYADGTNVNEQYGIDGSLQRRETNIPGNQPNEELYRFGADGNLRMDIYDRLFYSLYGYDGGTTRTYKYSFDLNPNWVNGRLESVSFNLHNAMFYPNNYLNFNADGHYTKHYYNGMERIASRLGDQNISINVNDPELQDRKDQLDSNIRRNIVGITGYEFLPVGEEQTIDDPKPVFELPQVGITGLQPSADGIYYYHPNHLGSTCYVTDGNASVVQGFLYAPFGEITNEYNNSFGSSVLPKYSFNAKELDEETGMYYYEARYMAPPVFISRDPLFEKYPTFSPYAYCANNPVNVIDPDGRDTVNIKYNTTNNKWEIGNPTLAEGDDIYNVTDADGNTTTHTFSEGTYKNRMNIILLEDNYEKDAKGNVTVNESFGIYHLSGTTETGFVLQPSENQKKHPYNGVGKYTSFIGKGEKWNNYIGIKLSVLDAVDEGIRIHYGTGRSWSSGCLIISSEYSDNGNKPKSFNLAKSQAAVCALVKYAGGIPKGTKQMGTTSRGAPRYRDYYIYGKFTAPTVTIKK